MKYLQNNIPASAMNIDTPTYFHTKYFFFTYHKPLLRLFCRGDSCKLEGYTG